MTIGTEAAVTPSSAHSKASSFKTSRFFELYLASAFAG